MTQTAAPLDPASELQLLIRSNHTLILVDSVEEERIEALVTLSAQHLQRQLYAWTITSGLSPWGDQGTYTETQQPVDALRMIARTSQGGIYLMRDMAQHLGDATIDRLVRDIAQRDTVTLILTGEPPDEMSDGVKSLSAHYVLPRPSVDMISSRINMLVQQLTHRGRMTNELDAAAMKDLAMSLRGLTLDEIDRIVLRLIERDGKLDAADIPDALAAKSDLLAQDGVVELVSSTSGLEWVAGFAQFKSWVNVRARAFDPSAVAFGLTPPRGIMLTGVPGCGKSMAVKALSADWHMPLLHLDAGAIYDRFIGGSERNLREAFRTAESLAPSILWIDEIEKGFGTRGPSETDGGLGYRLVGMLATWMQERKAAVFVAATSNDITLLPPEMTRQGRFDEIFFVDLPDAVERQHLFALQLARRGRDHSTFDCPALAEASDGFSGSEVEQAIVNSLYAAFAAGRELQTSDIVTELAATRPLAHMQPERIESMRAWGADHARGV